METIKWLEKVYTNHIMVFLRNHYQSYTLQFATIWSKPVIVTIILLLILFPFCLGGLTMYNLSMVILVESSDQILSFIILNGITCIFQELLLTWLSRPVFWWPITWCGTNGSSTGQWKLIHILFCSTIWSTCHRSKFQKKNYSKIIVVLLEKHKTHVVLSLAA